MRNENAKQIPKTEGNNISEIKSLEKLGLVFVGDAGSNRIRFEKDHAVFFIYHPDMRYIAEMIENEGVSKTWTKERREQNIAYELTRSAVFLVDEIKVSLQV